MYTAYSTKASFLQPSIRLPGWQQKASSLDDNPLVCMSCYGQVTTVDGYASHCLSTIVLKVTEKLKGTIALMFSCTSFRDFRKVNNSAKSKGISIILITNILS